MIVLSSSIISRNAGRVGPVTAEEANNRKRRLGEFVSPRAVRPIALFSLVPLWLAQAREAPSLLSLIEGCDWPINTHLILSPWVAVILPAGFFLLIASNFFEDTA
jgi:hypothetical protein